ncbi:MAG: nuclear transport factor 2 family protein [Desulfovibrio sp.]|uniref:YybH family protein n=1 Tax=Desulfovibrio sp. TaxID=885 RepID=UPI0025C4BCAE|nr:nuclear transport factor 2 family protein [Desulfovibrio sp.]MBS6829482.1 nuclear transport factor 2 family protein [Desulfovibrio sp.]
MRKICGICLGLLVVLCSLATADAAEPRADQQHIADMVELYRQSVIHADDIHRAEQVWLTTPQASFIHPRGHERGWEEIKRNFYGKTMRDTFSRRGLQLTTAPSIRLHGDAAVVEFDWEFTATRRRDGNIRHTAGRESQVYFRTPQGWKLVQVHYSGPPAP